MLRHGLCRGLRPSSPTKRAVTSPGLGADLLILLLSARPQVLRAFTAGPSVSEEKNVLGVLRGSPQVGISHGLEFHVGWNVWFKPRRRMKEAHREIPKKRRNRPGTRGRDGDKRAAGRQSQEWHGGVGEVGSRERRCRDGRDNVVQATTQCWRHAPHQTQPGSHGPNQDPALTTPRCGREGNPVALGSECP